MSFLSSFGIGNFHSIETSQHWDFGAESIASGTTDTEGMDESDSEPPHLLFDLPDCSAPGSFESLSGQGYVGVHSCNMHNYSGEMAYSNHMPTGAYPTSSFHWTTTEQSSASSSLEAHLSYVPTQSLGPARSTIVLPAENSDLVAEDNSKGPLLVVRQKTTKKAQRGQRKSAAVAPNDPSRGRNRAVQAPSTSYNEEEDEGYKIRSKPTGKQKRKTVKNQAPGILDVHPGIRLSSPIRSSTPYIQGMCNASQYVHMKISTSKEEAYEPYKLEVALPARAESVRLDCLVVPKSDLQHLTRWHQLNELKDFNNSVHLPWNHGSARWVDDEEEQDPSIRGTPRSSSNSLVRTLYDLDLPGSSALIAYLRVRYNMPGSSKVLSLFTQPFVVYTQLTQRQKGMGYLLHLFVDLDIRSTNHPVAISKFLESLNRILREGSSSSDDNRHIKLQDVQAIQNEKQLRLDSMLRPEDVHRITATLCPLLYALRCKSRHPQVKKQWNANLPIDQVMALLGDYHELEPEDPEKMSPKPKKMSPMPKEA